MKIPTYEQFRKMLKEDDEAFGKLAAELGIATIVLESVTTHDIAQWAWDVHTLMSNDKGYLYLIRPIGSDFDVLVGSSSPMKDEDLRALEKMLTYKEEDE